LSRNTVLTMRPIILIEGELLSRNTVLTKYGINHETIILIEGELLSRNTVLTMRPLY